MKGEITMRKVIVSCFMSLDGVIENPMWTVPYWGDDIAAYQGRDTENADLLLMGRKTYEGFAAAWPSRTDVESGGAYFNAVKKVVASRTLTETPWNNTSVLQGDVGDAIAALKAQPGKNILKYGGGGLLQLLMERGLLDELHVLVYPVVVGVGARLFPDGAQGTLQLAQTQTFASGVIALDYHAVR
jgi:dihydrofolate reductase